MINNRIFLGSAPDYVVHGKGIYRNVNGSGWVGLYGCELRGLMGLYEWFHCLGLVGLRNEF